MRSGVSVEPVEQRAVWLLAGRGDIGRVGVEEIHLRGDECVGHARGGVDLLRRSARERPSGDAAFAGWG